MAAVPVANQNTSSLPQTSLYVGDLHLSCTENMLFTKFSEVGQVLNVRICRDLATRASLGYAYVNFENPKDAERALDNLNYETLFGRPIRIMWSQRDPSLRKSGRGNIFIKNLDKSIEQKELYDTFAMFGRILSCKIAMDEHGKSKGYGFIHFEKEACAEAAIERVNQKLIRKRVVFVGKFIPNSDRKQQYGKTRFNNIYVKNFPPETTDEMLRDMFKEFGEIKSCCVEKDAEGKSRGFGFVCFVDPDHAEAAVKAMHGHEINGKQLYACRAQRKEERLEEIKQRIEKQRAERQSKYISGVNLYVKNLDDSIDDERLKETFCQYGPITSAKVMTDSNGRSKGFGFVCFTQPDQAARAVTEMNATLVGSKPLYVALAQRKEDRRAKLIAEHQQRIAQYRSGVAQMIPNAAAHPAAPGYFPPSAFPAAQRFYHPQNAVINAQPRWNRPGVMAGMPGQLGGVPSRPPMPGHYLGAPNPAAGLSASQMAAMTQLRAPAGVNRPMLSGMPTMPAGLSMPTANMINPNAQRQAAGRQVPMQQVMAPPTGGLPQRPSMASVVASPVNVNAHVRPINQMQRGMMHESLGQVPGAAGNVLFNQTARNVAQSVPSMPGRIAPIGDQAALTLDSLADMSKDQQRRSLGERLFPLVQNYQPAHANKLTGMLLGVDSAEVIHLLENEESLRAKLDEAMAVLKTNRNVSAEHVDSTNTSADAMGNGKPGQNGDGSSGVTGLIDKKPLAGDAVNADA